MERCLTVSRSKPSGKWNKFSALFAVLGPLRWLILECLWWIFLKILMREEFDGGIPARGLKEETTLCNSLLMTCSADEFGCETD
jgi:hypothetical protein